MTPAGGVILAFADGDPITGSTATVQIGFDGDAATCAANGGAVLGRSTLGQLSWSGAGNGSRTVALRLERGAASETFDVEPGSLSVSFTVCGLSASISRTVRGEPPVLGDISISGTPTEGAEMTASVGYSYGPGWSVGNASWTGGPCESQSSLGGSTGPDSSSASFTASAPGRYCVAVVVSLRRRGRWRYRGDAIVGHRRRTGIDVDHRPRRDHHHRPVGHDDAGHHDDDDAAVVHRAADHPCPDHPCPDNGATDHRCADDGTAGHDHHDHHATDDHHDGRRLSAPKEPSNV